MQNIDYTLSSSKNLIKEINFMLYNYNNIDKLIQNRKSNLIDRINYSPSAWYKGLKQDSNTLEDIIVSFDEDKVIQRYEHWRAFLGSLFSVIRNFESPIYYKYLVLRYFRNLGKEETIKQLNINENMYKSIKSHFYLIVYRYALKDSLFKEVQNNVAV